MGQAFYVTIIKYWTSLQLFLMVAFSVFICELSTPKPTLVIYKFFFFFFYVMVNVNAKLCENYLECCEQFLEVEQNNSS